MSSEFKPAILERYKNDLDPYCPAEDHTSIGYVFTNLPYTDILLRLLVD
jgi:hypothetical protein